MIVKHDMCSLCLRSVQFLVSAEPNYHISFQTLKIQSCFFQRDVLLENESVVKTKIIVHQIDNSTEMAFDAKLVMVFYL